jgi:two-component system, cell cycle sensor histidine kinase and response regulator CckA
MDCILVVESDPHMKKGVTLVLEGRGYEVWSAGDAAEALSLIIDHDFDLLITDVELPDTTGLELARRCRYLLQHPLPVLFMSGFAVGVLFARDRLQQGMLLLEKPFTARALLDAISGALADRFMNGDPEET